MSTQHLDSGAYPALGSASNSRKTPAPWDVDRGPPDLIPPLREVRPRTNRAARGSATNLRVVRESSNPHAAATESPDLGVTVSARAWWTFQAGLLAASVLALLAL